MSNSSSISNNPPTFEDEKFLAQQNQQLQQKQEKKQEPIVVNQPVRLLVGIPYTPHVDAPWAFNLATRFVTGFLPPNSGFIFESKYGIAPTRESIVNIFKSSPGATHLLFYDSDILLTEPHAIATLINDTLADPKAYIVSGCYYNSLYTGLAAWKDEQPLKYQDLINNSQNPVVEVDKVGMGCMIIRRDLFDVIVGEERPLFYYKMEEGNYSESEDFFFLKKLKKYGIKPYLDIRVKCQHIKRCLLNVDGTINF